jgi:hypothetical protein
MMTASITILACCQEDFTGHIFLLEMRRLHPTIQNHQALKERDIPTYAIENIKVRGWASSVPLKLDTHITPSVMSPVLFLITTDQLFHRFHLQ